MPSPRKSEKEKQREELAALLREPVFLRDEAAPMVGFTPDTMNTEPHKRPPYFQKKTGSTALYPQSWLKEFARTGRVVSPTTGKMMFGSHPWPPAPPPPASAVSAPPKKRINKKKQDAAIFVLDLIEETDPEHRKKVSEGWSE